jgi:hypothetical protein
MRHSRALSWHAVIALVTIFCAALVGCADSAAAPSPVPGVTVTVNSSSLALAEDDRLTIDVTIARSAGFAGPITLGVTGLPANVTAQVAANPVTGDKATLDIVAGPGVTPGFYRLTLTATGAGVQANPIVIDLTVTAASSTTATVAYCSVLAPVWVAFQDGNGTWTRVSPTMVGSNTVYRRLFVTNRGGIATLTPFLDGALTLLNVLYGTPAELASAGDTNPIDCGASVAKTLFGQVSGLDDNESALISSGPFLRASVPVGRSSFQLTGLPSGPHDLLATRTTLANASAAVTRLLLRRNIDLPDSATLPTLDFASNEAFDPATANVRIAGLGLDGATSGTRLRTSNSEMVLSFLTNQPTDVTRPYFALPETRLLPGDLQVLHVSSDMPSRVNRDADVYFRAPVDRTVSLGAPLIPPTISTVATSPSLRVRAQFVPQSDYDQSTSIFLEQAAGSALVSLSMTAAYASVANGFDLVVPDLSAVAGFDPAWALRSGGTLIWAATRVGGTLALGRDAVPSDGTTQRRAFLQDTFTPP